MTWFKQFDFSLGSWIEIMCLAIIFYYLLFVFRGTRGISALIGFVSLFLIMLFVTNVFHLYVLNWLLGRVSVYLAIVFVVIFQPELRRILSEIGKQHFFAGPAAEREVIDSVIEAVVLLSQRKIGALIAIERAIGVRNVQETGIQMDAVVSSELLSTIFFPYTPLHDGGILISSNRLVAAGCVFPLSMREEFSRVLGTRHRAAVGLTEETDAVVVVVSEETGGISLSQSGRLLQNLEIEQLRRLLNGALRKSHFARHRLSVMRDKLFEIAAVVIKPVTNKISDGEQR